MPTLLLFEMVRFFGAALALGSVVFSLTFYFKQFRPDADLNATEEDFLATTRFVLVLGSATVLAAEFALYLYLRTIQLDTLLGASTYMKWTLLGISVAALILQYRRLVPLWLTSALLAGSWIMYGIVLSLETLPLAYTLWLGYFLVFLGLVILLLEGVRRIWYPLSTHEPSP